MTEPAHPLCLHFLPNLGRAAAEAEAAFSAGGDDSLEAELAALLADASAAWPRVRLGFEVFLPYLARRVPDSPPGKAPALRQLHITDLYLACASVRGDVRALEAFDERHRQTMAIALSGLRLPPAQADDVKQTVRQRLLVGDETCGPRLRQYDGRGALKSWLSVVVTREALGTMRKGRREVLLGRESDLDRLMEGASPTDDQELAHLKRLYRGKFRAAFAEAMGALTSRQRNLLRHRYLDGLNIDQIGGLYGVHRATTARWLKAAQEQLFDHTRRSLVDQLQVSPESVDSILHLIGSDLEVSFSRLLG